MSMPATQRQDSPLLLMLITIVLLAVSSNVFAHKVNMFAFVEGDKVFVEGYFADGKRAQNSTVIVFDEEGKELLRGVTDDEGAYSFQVPEAKVLRISLNASMGHKTEYVLSKEELAGALPVGDAGGSTGPVEQEESAAATTEDTTAAGNTLAADEMAIRRAVGQAILPLMRSISELEERSSFSDIIGGIGFIMGIGGLFFYFKARKLMSDINSSGFRKQDDNR